MVKGTIAAVLGLLFLVAAGFVMMDQARDTSETQEEIRNRIEAYEAERGEVSDKNNPNLGKTGGGTCLRIGTADSDPTIFNLEWDGYDAEYENGLWFINQIEIGGAPEEDAAFMACGPSWLIETMAQYQQDAIKAGAQPEFGE